MSQTITEQDLGVLKATGFPLATAVEKHNPTHEEVLQTVRKALHVSQQPRLVEAVVVALLYLAKQATCSTKPNNLSRKFKLLLYSETDEKTLRRLGFLLESLADVVKEHEDLRYWLTMWAAMITEHLAQREENTPLALFDRMTKRVLQRWQQSANEINRHWNVYGSFEIRPHLLQQILPS